VILADAAKSAELLTQTRRHTYIVSMLGIRHLVLAVNKMDLVGFDRAVFESLAGKYRAFAKQLGVDHVECIPLSALRGDNVVTRSERMPWYHGPALLPFLETVEFEAESAQRPFRMPVQWVNRPNSEFRGFAGTVTSGVLRQGDRIKVLPSAREAQVARIVTRDGDLAQAVSGQAVTVVLDQEVDVSRGNVLCDAGEPAAIADQFAVHLLWMSAEELLPGRSYLLKIGTQSTPATVAPLKYRINVDTLEHVAASQLELNDIGVCDLELARPVVFEPYARNRDLGGFLLIDRMTFDTVGAGLVRFALRRSANVSWQHFDLDRTARALLNGHRSCVVWFTGLSGAGKSTIANLVERRLHVMGCHTYLLDGDNVRHGLNKDLGFTAADRVENIRRVAEVARLMADAGLIVLVSAISPFRAERRMARELMDPGTFFEVFVDVPLSVAEQRDPKGLYRKARRGELLNFTGIDSPYEAPEQPELRIDTTTVPADEGAALVLSQLRAANIIPER